MQFLLLLILVLLSSFLFSEGRFFHSSPSYRLTHHDDDIEMVSLPPLPFSHITNENDKSSINPYQRGPRNNFLLEFDKLSQKTYEIILKTSPIFSSLSKHSLKIYMAYFFIKKVNSLLPEVKKNIISKYFTKKIHKKKTLKHKKKNSKKKKTEEIPSNHTEEDESETIIDPSHTSHPSSSPSEEPPATETPRSHPIPSAITSETIDEIWQALMTLHNTMTSMDALTQSLTQKLESLALSPPLPSSSSNEESMIHFSSKITELEKKISTKINDLETKLQLDIDQRYEKQQQNLKEFLKNLQKDVKEIVSKRN